jgi:threonine dehydratase
MEATQEKSKLISIDTIRTAQARLTDVIIETPYLEHFGLSEKHDCQLFLKREDMQIVRSFKIRGAYNKIKSLPESELTNGVVCASAGNHAQGVALACSMLQIKANIYMPNPTPKQKIKKVRQFGKSWVNIILHGDSFDDAYDKAMEDASSRSAAFIHPFNDEDVIAGQGTIAAEMLDCNLPPLDYLFVAVGGGGLLSGVGSYYKQVSPHTKIIAVEAAGAAALGKSLEHNEVHRLESIDTFADGIAVKEIGQKTFRLCKEVIDEYIAVPEGKICTAILELYNDEAIVVEPAGAVSIAALDFYKEKIKGKNVGIIICGGNNDITRTQEIRERSLLYEGKKHYFIIRFPQRAGALKEFLDILGPNDDITHFEYTKKHNRESGPAMVGIELKDKADYDPLFQRMEQSDFEFQHINNTPLLFDMLV